MASSTSATITVSSPNAAELGHLLVKCFTLGSLFESVIPEKSVSGWRIGGNAWGWAAGSCEAELLGAAGGGQETFLKRVQDHSQANAPYRAHKKNACGGEHRRHETLQILLEL